MMCIRIVRICIFYLGFFHEHSRFKGQQEKGEATSLTTLYNFHPLHRHLDFRRVDGFEPGTLSFRETLVFRVQVANH